MISGSWTSIQKKINEVLKENLNEFLMRIIQESYVIDNTKKNNSKILINYIVVKSECPREKYIIKKIKFLGQDICDSNILI